MQTEPTLLFFSIFAPLVVAVTLFFFGRSLSQRSVHAFALVGFLVPVAIAIYLWTQFSGAEKGIGGYAFLGQWDTGLRETLGISLLLGLNGISLPLFALAGIVGLAAGLHAMRSEQVEQQYQYLALLLVMLGGLMGTFASVDIFFFYFFHELALIPTFIMIARWGGPARKSAAMEMTVYLTLGAMISLLGLIALYGTSSWDTSIGFNLIALKQYVAMTPIGEVLQHNIFALLLFGFGILVSLFPFHSWAPRGYAEAPTANAMLHAGVLKKFGLYGLVQVALPLLPQGGIGWNSWIVWLALGNVVIIGLVTMAQRDLKYMIGYASVMHMGYIFLGIATLSVAGVGGAVMLMFAHGLSVALLFALSHSIYKRTGTYDMQAMGGLGPKAPVLAGLFVAATMASIGLPGFANFWGEFTIFIALWQNHAWAMAPAVLGIVISAIYGLRAVARIFYGEPTEAFAARLKTEGANIRDIGWCERVPVVLLFIALVGVGVLPRLISDDVNIGVRTEAVYQMGPQLLGLESLADTEASASFPAGTTSAAAPAPANMTFVVESIEAVPAAAAPATTAPAAAASAATVPASTPASAPAAAPTAQQGN